MPIQIAKPSKHAKRSESSANAVVNFLQVAAQHQYTRLLQQQRLERKLASNEEAFQEARKVSWVKIEYSRAAVTPYDT